MLHGARDLLMRQRTQLINALRAHMAELGIVAAQGREGVKELVKIIASEQDARLPVDAHASLVVLAAGLQALQTMIGSIERRIIAQHRSDEASKRLRSIPGIGIVGATAIAATVTDPKVFRSGRLCSLDRDRTAARVDRWQTETGADLETRRPISETHSGGGSPCGVEAGPPPTGEVSVGSHDFSNAGRSGSWLWQLPTRWRASPGRYWQGAAAIGRLHLRQRRKGLARAE